MARSVSGSGTAEAASTESDIQLSIKPSLEPPETTTQPDGDDDLAPIEWDSGEDGEGIGIFIPNAWLPDDKGKVSSNDRDDLSVPASGDARRDHR
jgi:hypothetical protein